MRSARFVCLAVCLCLSIVLVPSLSAEGQWSQWRGPDRTGEVHSASWPADLSGLKQLWRVELGKGYGGAIVSEDRVFVVETVDDATVGVRALDRATGKNLWRRAWSATGDVPFFAARSGDWVRSTPAFDGETLYVGDMEEVLWALDGKTGLERWKVDFPARFGTKFPEFGFASSPLVAGNVLYVQAANSVVKLDKRSGETLWRSLDSEGNIMDSGAFSSPILAPIHGMEQLIVQTRHELCGVNPADGAALWCQEVPNFRGMNILTPLVWGDTIFTSTYQNSSFLYRVVKTDGGFAVEQVWKNKAQAYMSSPVEVKGHAFLHLGNGRLDCIDLATGESKWRSGSVGDYWSMVTDGERILALAEDGTLHLVAADPAGFAAVDSAQVSESPTWGHLAIAGSELFVRELEAVSAWRWEAGSGSRAEDAVAAGAGIEAP